MMHEIFAALPKPGLEADTLFSGELPEDALADFDADMADRLRAILPAALGPAYRDAGAHDGSTIYTRTAADDPEAPHEEFLPGLVVSLYDNAVEIAFSLANRPDYLVANIDEALNIASELREAGLRVFDPMLERELGSEDEIAGAREALLVGVGRLIATLLDGEGVPMDSPAGQQA